MLGRSAASRVLWNAFRNVGRQPVRQMSEVARKSGLELATISRCTLNDLSVPAGSFIEHHQKRNARWNIQLLVSSAIFCTTFAMMFYTGTINLHMRPPKSAMKIDPSRPLVDNV